MHWKFKTAKLGGHIHVTLFAGKNANHTLQNHGDLVFDEEGWREFRRIFGMGISESVTGNETYNVVGELEQL